MARQLTNKIAISVLATLSSLAFVGTAQASCQSGTSCHSIKTQHPAYNPPALSTWSHHNGHQAAQNHHSTARHTTSYTSTAPARYVTSQRSVSRAACPAGSSRQADGICLSTSSSFSSRSISSTSSNYSVSPLTRSVVTGLGVNESLQATNCPVAVHNPSGAKVLGCYNVVKPKPVVRTVVRSVPTVYQVVRPVIYVRTPVPVCNTCCSPKIVNSRYGATSQPVSKCGW